MRVGAMLAMIMAAGCGNAPAPVAVAPPVAAKPTESPAVAAIRKRFPDRVEVQLLIRWDGGGYFFKPGIWCDLCGSSRRGYRTVTSIVVNNAPVVAVDHSARKSHHATMTFLLRPEDAAQVSGGHDELGEPFAMLSLNSDGADRNQPDDPLLAVRVAATAGYECRLLGTPMVLPVPIARKDLETAPETRAATPAPQQASK